MREYNGTIYRPPIEANTFLLPVTEGCTHNSCTFCNMYDGIPFCMWKMDEIEEYMQEIVREYWNYLERQERIFLIGGDPFALSADKLEALMELNGTPASGFKKKSSIRPSIKSSEEASET